MHKNEAKFLNNINFPHCLLYGGETIKKLFWDHLCNMRYALLDSNQLLETSDKCVILWGNPVLRGSRGLGGVV